MAKLAAYRSHLRLRELGLRLRRRRLRRLRLASGLRRNELRAQRVERSHRKRPPTREGRTQEVRMPFRFGAVTAVRTYCEVHQCGDEGARVIIAGGNAAV